MCIRDSYQTRAKAIEAQKPAKRVSASTNPEDAENVLDEKINTAWQDVYKRQVKPNPSIQKRSVFINLMC